MFGENIIKVQCDLTGDTIKTGETFINKDMSMEINPYIDTNLKLYTTDFDDLIFDYIITKVMYTDGTLLEP